MSRLSLVTAGCLDAHIIGFPSQSVAWEGHLSFLCCALSDGNLRKSCNKTTIAPGGVYQCWAGGSPSWGLTNPLQSSTAATTA